MSSICRGVWTKMDVQGDGNVEVCAGRSDANSEGCI